MVQAEEVARPQPQLFVGEQQIGGDNDGLHCPGRKRSSCGAGGAHTRRAEVAEDQHIVDSHINDQGYEKADSHRLHTAQAAQQDIGKGKQRVGKADNAQVLHALCDDALLIGEKREAEMREEKDRRP